ncbi:MAG: sugar ABC transporter permease, partial [Spirochaeta sp. LUC14_002_19_P3]
ISFLRIAHPFELYGSELSVIAATVLGGAYIGGGKGTVYGTITGILLIIVINNSLILLGIPSYWQQFVIGTILLCSVSIPVFLDNLTRENV